MVVSTTNDVNRPARAADYSSSQARYAVCVTLEERINWLVEHRADGNQRELSRRAGLSPNYVGTLLTRLRKNPNAQVERDSLTALATAGGVSIDWLLVGSVDPERQVVLDVGSPLRMLAGWADALVQAIASAAYLPSWVWPGTAEIRNAHAPVPLTPEFLVRTALYVYETAGLEEKARLALEATRAEIAEHNAAVHAAEAGDPQQKLR